MSVFTRIHVQGFRRLYDVDLALKPLNVFIGANGCGKTSLLDVFSLLAASASGRLRDCLLDLGGVDANLTSLSDANGGVVNCLDFNLTMEKPRRIPIEYHIAISPYGVRYRISAEDLTQISFKDAPTLKHIQSNHGDVRYFEFNAKRPRIRKTKLGIQPR